MQLPPASSASQAASMLAQSVSKDKSLGASAADAATVQTSTPTVEKSESADKDRDAQGQGDGFSSRRKTPPENDDILDFDNVQEPQHHAAQLPGEPPSELDIVG